MMCRCKIKKLLNHVIERLERIELNTERILIMDAAGLAAIQRLNVATNGIATVVTSLRDRLAAGADGNSAEFLAAMDAVSARLEGYAADPANVVPDVTPIPIP